MDTRNWVTTRRKLKRNINKSLRLKCYGGGSKEISIELELRNYELAE